MLKHLYKTLLIAVLSGSLMSFQMSVAMADSSVITTDSTGNKTVTSKYNFEKISDADMLASLAMLAGGFITGRMLAVYKPMTPDVLVAGVGGAAFVAGEIISNVKFKGTIDAMTEEVIKQDGASATVNEAQLQRLQDLRKSYEEAKSTTKTKKIMQLAAAAAFGVASVTAGYIAYSEFAAMKLCSSNIFAASNAASACVEAHEAAPVSESLLALCGKCGTDLASLNTQMTLINRNRASPGPSKSEETTIKPLEQKAELKAVDTCKEAPASVKAAGALVTSSCGAALKIASLDQIYKYKILIVSDNSILKNILMANVDNRINYEMMQSLDYTNPSIIEKALNLFFPRAQAGWLPLLGLGASTAAAFTLMSGTTAAEIDLMMFVPFNRSIAFGALAGVAYMASRSSDNVMEKLDANIAKLDAIIADLTKLNEGVKTTNLATTSVAATTASPTMAQVNFSTTGATTTCLNSESSSNCKSLESDLVTSTGFASLPTSLQELSTEAAKVGNGLSGTTGVSGSTLAAADALGNRAAAIRKLAQQREAAYEKLADGKVNIQKAKDNFLSGLSAKIKKDLQSQGLTAGGMMASMGSSPIDSSIVKSEEKTLAKTAPVAASAIDIGAGAKDNMKLDFKDAPTTGNFAVAAANKGPEYEIKGNDISGEKGPSIFEVISNRYLKSGYPKLLEVEQTKK